MQSQWQVQQGQDRLYVVQIFDKGCIPYNEFSRELLRGFVSPEKFLRYPSRVRPRVQSKMRGFPTVHHNMGKRLGILRLHIHECRLR